MWSACDYLEPVNVLDAVHLVMCHFLLVHSHVFVVWSAPACLMHLALPPP